MSARKIIIFLFILQAFFQLIACYSEYLSYGPRVKASVGKVWPIPFWQDDTGRYYSVDPNDFELLVVNENCDMLQTAIERYTNIIKKSALSHHRAPATETVGAIRQIHINLTVACEILPHLNMDETYYVWGDGRVIANSIWGILRGLETLSQLLIPMPNGMLRIPETEIYDQPRFKYRGFMLDSARHFISKAKILQILDGMVYNKLNVFHWHITDDSAFPFQSDIFPELSAMGAYSPELVYTVSDVKEIVEYARLRGIRVIPEFDTPAHTASWGASHPEIMTKCSYGGPLGPLHILKNETYNLLYKFFSEIKQIFPDQYIHIGGDEIDADCWESNEEISKYVEDNNIEIYNDVYFSRFLPNISSMGWTQIAWHEGILNGEYKWPKGTIGQIWLNYASTAKTLISLGYDVIRSEGWYLSSSDSIGDWQIFYKKDPHHFKATAEKKKHVLGGEACVWTENINEHNVIPKTFPRVSAIAERLWSEKAHRDVSSARVRLEEHNCRMLFRGIEAQPANDFGEC